MKVIFIWDIHSIRIAVIARKCERRCAHTMKNIFIGRIYLLTNTFLNIRMRMYQKCADADNLASVSAGINQSLTHIHFERDPSLGKLGSQSHDRMTETSGGH